MTQAPLYRWSVTDHLRGRSWSGEESGQRLAQAAAVEQLRRIGRGLHGVSATVFRPSGGGWFARPGRGAGAYTWEAWERERV